MTVDPYDDIYQELRREIADLAPGEPIPSVRRLMARFELSQGVIDRIMGQLREEFEIISQVGRGSFKGEQQVVRTVRSRGVIDFYQPDGYSVFQQDLYRAVRAEVEGAGLELRLHRYPWDRMPRRFDASEDAFGMLIVPTSYLSGSNLASIEAVRVPLVLLDHIPHGLRLHGVASDNAYGGALAADHLLSQGITRLAMISVEPEVNTNVGARLRGFQRQCRLAGVPEPLLIGGHSPLGTAGLDAGYELMSAALADGPRAFDGIFADSAASAMGAMKACRDAGVHVPDDLALVAFDDTPEARFMHPTISVLKQDVEAWVAAALTIISDLKATTGVVVPQHVQIAPHLIVRESSRTRVSVADTVSV